jgi:hypothetical protein
MQDSVNGYYLLLRIQYAYKIYLGYIHTGYIHTYIYVCMHVCMYVYILVLLYSFICFSPSLFLLHIQYVYIICL